MREIFDSELERISKISKYNKERAYSMLDDMATAFISVDQYGHLDNALIAVRQAKKSLRASGYDRDFIQDYFLQRSYLSKTTLRQLRNESIYTDDSTQLKPVIENRIASHCDKSTTDLIIDELQKRPTLLNALKKGIDKSNLSRTYKINSPVLLQNFYEKHKSIIES